MKENYSITQLHGRFEKREGLKPFPRNKEKRKMKEITIPKEITIADWGETYKVNLGLTKKLNMPDWVIFKEPGYKLWGYNEKLNIIVYLFCNKISLKDPLLDKVIWFWRWLIIERVKEALGGRNEATEN